MYRLRWLIFKVFSWRSQHNHFQSLFTETLLTSLPSLTLTALSCAAFDCSLIGPVSASLVDFSEPSWLVARRSRSRSGRVWRSGSRCSGTFGRRRRPSSRGCRSGLARWSCTRRPRRSGRTPRCWRRTPARWSRQSRARWGPRWRRSCRPTGGKPPWTRPRGRDGPRPRHDAAVCERIVLGFESNQQHADYQNELRKQKSENKKTIVKKLKSFFRKFQKNKFEVFRNK